MKKIVLKQSPSSQKKITKNNLNEIVVERIVLNIVPVWDFYLKL